VNHEYDTYDSAIVCAENEEEARKTNPGGFHVWHDGSWYFQYMDGTEKPCEDTTWCNIEDVKVEFIGEAREGLAKGIICASFNAG